MRMRLHSRYVPTTKAPSGWYECRGWSFCAASCCMCCPRASSAFAITDCWQRRARRTSWSKRVGRCNYPGQTRGPWSRPRTSWHGWPRSMCCRARCAGQASCTSCRCWRGSSACLRQGYVLCRRIGGRRKERDGRVQVQVVPAPVTVRGVLPRARRAPGQSMAGEAPVRPQGSRGPHAHSACIVQMPARIARRCAITCPNGQVVQSIPLMPPPPADLVGGSAQQGISAAGAALDFYRLGLAADKRYSLDATGDHSATAAFLNSYGGAPARSARPRSVGQDSQLT